MCQQRFPLSLVQISSHLHQQPAGLLLPGGKSQQYGGTTHLHSYKRRLNLSHVERVGDTSIAAVVGEALEDALISPEARSTARLPPLTVGHNDTMGTTVLNCDSSNLQ